MTLVHIISYSIVFIYGAIFGSFANVCIYRIPAKESLLSQSHCQVCGHQLKWYELIPIASWLVLRGKCRSCGEKIAVQYPLVEFANGLLYVIIMAVLGIHIESMIYCLLATALFVLSVIDFRTYEIPPSINWFIFVLGGIHLVYDRRNWLEYVIGFFCVSLFLLLLFYASGGRAMGGGDVKLMAAAGFLLGWKLIILAFFIGCMLGSVIHIARMRIQKKDHQLAMGPYLAAGIFLSVLWGNDIIQWYLLSFIAV